MPEHINEVIRRMREKAAENPDYVYLAPKRLDSDMHTCVYFEGGDPEAPSCLVGYGIAPIVTPDMFDVGGFKYEQEEADSVVEHLAARDVLEYDTNTQVQWIVLAQTAQDRKPPWAQAIAVADKEYPLNG